MRFQLSCCLLTVVAIALFGTRCSDDPISSPQPSFSFEVAVADQSGEAVEGLQVSVQERLYGLDAQTAAVDVSEQHNLGASAQHTVSSPLDIGDINCNGVPYDLNDARLYLEYFIFGPDVLDDHPVCSIEASDVNEDGNSLTVADLVYLIRIIVGDALPVNPGDTADAYVSIDPMSGVLAVEGERIGGAFICVAGEVVPELLANHMGVQYAFDGTQTNILVYSFDVDGFFSGDVLQIDGDLISVEAASYYGVPLRLKVMPYNAAFDQNYPNPFGGVTTFSFALPGTADFRLTVTNLANEVVDSIIGAASAGVTEFQWDAGASPDGVYRCMLSILDGDSLLFSESVYAAQWQPEPTILGYTSGGGAFETDDSTIFPGIWVLPELIQTNETGELIGNFGYSDTVTIVVTDTLAGINQSFDRVIRSGVNRFDLVWYRPD